MSTANGSLAAAIDTGVHAAFSAEGYVQEDGSKDSSKLRERMFEVLRPRKVINHRERGDKAVTRGEMVAQVFPSLPGPEHFTEHDNPDLTEAVWNKIDGILWSEAAPRHSAPLQRLVGLNMGNGYVLCRTKVGKDQTPAVYISDNVHCIERDFIKPDNDSLAAKLETVRRNREMLILRQPQNAKRYAHSFDQHVKAIGTAAHEQLTLAIESVATPLFDGDGQEQDEN